MHIALGVRGFSQIKRILEHQCPQDVILECGADDIVQVAQEVDVIVPIMTTVPQAALESPRLGLVQQYGVGLEVVAVDVATREGVLVANVPSVGSGNAESVAELAIAHMMMLGRQIPTAMQRVRERRFSGPMGSALWGSTVLILGYGGIGEEIARRLAGFGTRIIAVSRHGPAGARVRDASVRVDEHVAQDALMDVVGKADYIVVAAPAMADNIGLVGAQLFAAAKRGVYIVNIARGPVIDYAALLGALRDGQVAGAGLDVFWQEPCDPDDPLFQYNVIATPHVGGVTHESLQGIVDAVVRNIELLRRGELPANCVNPQAAARRKAGQLPLV